MRARASSFIARSASTYRCVVLGLSCPSRSAMTASSIRAERLIGPLRPMGKVGRAIEIRVHGVSGVTAFGQMALKRAEVRPLPHVVIERAV